MDHDTTPCQAAWTGTLPQRRQSDRRCTPATADPPPVTPQVHFPTFLIDAWQLRDGTRLTQRPILPQDAALLGEMYAGLSDTAKRQRFHGAVNALTPSWLERLSCVDYQRHLAFVITTQGDHGREHIVAEARYVIDATGNTTDNSAEFALVVADAWQRRGLGARAMRGLEAAALRAGLRWLHGEVLVSNRPMLALMQACGFCCTPDRNHASLMQAEVLLRKLPAQPSASLRLRRWLKSHRPQPINTLPLRVLGGQRP